MLSREEQRFVREHAYIPEHVPEYVQAVSHGEPFIHEGHLCFVCGRHLIFVGYPLPADHAGDPEELCESACRRFRPRTVSILAPEITALAGHEVPAEDSYYGLALPYGPLKPDIAYMIRRAGRELRVVQGEFGRDHARLIERFLEARNTTAGHREIFAAIPRYLSESTGARLLEARKGRELTAFDIVDTAAAHYLFYMFNFRSITSYVPGASDLLFSEMIRLAEQEGKTSVNLGLGINEGVRRFKEKWGGRPFLPYSSITIRRKTSAIWSLLEGLT